MDFLTEMKQLGFRIADDDKEFFEYSEEYTEITEFKGENWSKGDDYIVACLDDEDDLFFAYIDGHSSTIYAFTEKSDFEGGDIDIYIDIDIVRDLYSNHNIVREQIENFTDSYIFCNDDSVINKDMGTYTHIFEDRSSYFNGGANHIYYSKEECNFFVDSNRLGNDGLWEDIGEAFDYLYGNNILANDDNIGNQVCDIDEEEYFEFGLDELSVNKIKVNKINEDYRICVRVKLDDNYQDEDEIIMEAETKKCYEEIDCPECDEDERVYLSEIDISFNCAYVGSANGETFWVEKNIVEDVLGEDFSFDDFLTQDWSEDKEWIDFGFKEIADLDDYIIVCDNRLLKLDDFNTNCKSEDLV